MTRPEWEYDTREEDTPLSLQVLNQFGSDGWELVTLLYAQGTFHYVFKRVLKRPM